MIHRRSLAFALALGLAGCGGSLLPTPPPAPDIYRLSPAAQNAPSGAARARAAQILVGDVGAPAAIDTVRVAVNHDPTHAEYFAKSEWAERAPALVQNLLLETLEHSHAFTAVARRSLTLRADYIVAGELRRFEAEYRGSGPPTVQFALDLQLVRSSTGDIIAQRSFTAAVKAKADTIPATIEAFDTASHDALRDCAGWIATALPAAAKRP